jgi:hypothetical protein
LENVRFYLKVVSVDIGIDHALPNGENLSFIEVHGDVRPVNTREAKRFYSCEVVDDSPGFSFSQRFINSEDVRVASGKNNWTSESDCCFS